MEKRPVIALYPSYDDGDARQTMLLRYVRAVELGGGVPFVLPLTEDARSLSVLADMCGGALFTGGDDVHPSRYGCCLHEGCGSISLKRDAGEFAFAEAFLKTGKPFLGICRGIQFLNVVFGGTLYQDIPSEHGKSVNHSQPPPYDVPSHTVTPVPGGLFQAIAGGFDSKKPADVNKNRVFIESIYEEKAIYEVNSMHHQAVSRLGSGLVAEAYSPDGIIEAIRDPGRDWGFAVQWHPECMVERDVLSLRIFKNFIETVKVGGR